MCVPVGIEGRRGETRRHAVSQGTRSGLTFVKVPTFTSKFLLLFLALHSPLELHCLLAEPVCFVDQKLDFLAPFEHLR